MSTLVPTGTPIVLLNAFPVDRAQWEPFIDVLHDEYDFSGDLISFDMPGIGDMPMVDEDPSLELIADAAVAGMREATGHDAAMWIGCSMGGYIAMAIAERDADAVAGLGLLGTRSGADNAAGVTKRIALADSLEGKSGAPDPRGMAEGLVGTQGARREELVALVAQNIGRHSGDAIAWGQRAMAARPDRTEVLRGLDVPAAVVVGEHDAVVTLEHAQVMAAALGVEATVLPGVGHLSALEDPHAVAHALKVLLEP
jgi:pimeloyl-ACP methyl ester carboxylesterase